MSGDCSSARRYRCFPTTLPISCRSLIMSFDLSAGSTDSPRRWPSMRTILPALGAFILVTLVLLWGCEQQERPSAYVARVGDQYLTQAELSDALASLGAAVDTAEARRQIVEQWITRALLLEEAERRSLRDDPAVQEQLRQQEDAILVSALTADLYENFSETPTTAEIQTYYERHKNQMTVREPFARVRHFATSNEEDAQAVVRLLRTIPADDPASDSLWQSLLDRYAPAPEDALRLSEEYVPENAVFGDQPDLRERYDGLRTGDVSSVFEANSKYHVLQVTDRVPAGSVPEISWVEDEIRRRLTMRARKQMYAREVQRLRNEAQARNDLEIH